MTNASDGMSWNIEFPNHWKPSRIGKVTSKIGSGATPKGGATVYSDSGTPLIRVLNVHNDGFREANLVYINDEYASQLEYASVEPNDVLLNITGPSRSALAPSDLLPARVNQHVSILRPNDHVIPGFLHAWLISPTMFSFMCSRSVGSTREAITKYQLQHFPIMLPPRHEQEAIVRFLDVKTAEIDGLVSKLERERELLERYRRELIAHTVTRGLDPNVSMRDSGIEWIGDVPEHWKISNIKREMLSVGSGTTPDSKNSRYYAGFVPWIQSGDLYNRTEIHKSEKFVSPSALEDYPSLKVYKSPFLVVAMYGASAGNAANSQIDATVNQACCALKAPTSLQQRFSLYWIQASKSALLAETQGGGQSNLNQKIIKRWPYPIIPESELNDIVSHLDVNTAEVNVLIEKINTQIELLGKYRKQIINDVVTGKIRVGEVA